MLVSLYLSTAWWIKLITSENGCYTIIIQDLRVIQQLSSWLVLVDVGQERYYVIYDLRFDCRYVVRVERAVVPGDSAHVVVSTPSCRNVHTPPGHRKPDCPATSGMMSLSHTALRIIPYSMRHEINASFAFRDVSMFFEEKTTSS